MNAGMGYRSLRECLQDLERTGQLIRIEQEVDPYLEAAEIHRRVYEAGGPAVYYARVKGCRFPLVSNLFGTLERTRFLFRDTLERVRHLVELRLDPSLLARRPLDSLRALPLAWAMRPKFVSWGPVLAHTCRIRDLPQVQSWPKDGGPFITLPQVYSEDAEHPGWQRSNLGMYRVQLGGNQYRPDEEVGLHYQIHRGIGVHHAVALRRRVPFRVSIFVGGPPAMTLAAVMPLPEGMSELSFAGALGGSRVRLIRRPVPGDPLAESVLAADADFVITGVVEPDRLLPEGPFGDHLGYYSLVHLFPVLKVDGVYHRPDAIWPFTVVGRPPQEDTSFGQIIHEITGPVIPSVIQGVRAVHAVDAAGVHPLLLAIGSERYVPYNPRCKPQELLTCAHAILGQGQLSLAKYLLIVAWEDDPALDIHDIPAFFRHLLERVDWTNDLHFITRTTMDTLDYSGTGLNEGSKVIIAAVGAPRRELADRLQGDWPLPAGFGEPRLCLPGIVALRGPRYDPARRQAEREALAEALRRRDMAGLPLVVLVDDSDFTAATLRNFLWVCFTRSDPAADIHGVGAFCQDKHWGCTGPLIIDARIKPHHAPVVEPDPEVRRRVEALAAPGGPLHGII